MYVFPVASTLLLGLVSVGMAGITAGILYFVVLAVCVTQILRPTILGWSVLTVIFLAYLVGVAWQWDQPPRSEFVVFLAVGTIPSAALLCCWPKRIRVS